MKPKFPVWIDLSGIRHFNTSSVVPSIINENAKKRAVPFSSLSNKGLPTYGILSIRDSHEATVVIGGVRVSGEILRRQDVEIDEPRSMKFNQRLEIVLAPGRFVNLTFHQPHNEKILPWNFTPVPAEARFKPLKLSVISGLFYELCYCFWSYNIILTINTYWKETFLKLSPTSNGGWIWTLKLRIISWVFNQMRYHHYLYNKKNDLN